MAFATWDPSFSVKVAACDEDHKKLFSLLDSLLEAMKAGKGSQVVGQVVKELADYTKLHFRREEAMLEKTRYPELQAHRVQHAEFVKRVEKFREDLKTGNVGQSVAVANFLTDWLKNHIKRTDQQYSSHLNANGIS